MPNYLFIGYKDSGTFEGTLFKIKGAEPTEKEIRDIFESSGHHHDIVELDATYVLKAATLSSSNIKGFKKIATSMVNEEDLRSVEADEIRERELYEELKKKYG